MACVNSLEKPCGNAAKRGSIRESIYRHLPKAQLNRRGSVYASSEFHSEGFWWKAPPMSSTDTVNRHWVK